MTSSASETSPALHVFGGVDLAAVVSGRSPFATLLLSGGSGAEGRARLAIDEVVVPAPYAGLLLDAVDTESAGSQVIVVDADEHVTVVKIDDPLREDVARFGDVPSLGTVLESAQVTAPHVVLTVEDDVFAVTSFGTPNAAATDGLVFEAIDALEAHVHQLAPQMIAFIGASPALDDVVSYLHGRFDSARFVVHSTTDIDGDLVSLADQVVKDAASLAAENRTHELAHFRAARLASQTIEGQAVLSAIAQNTVQRVLVHDDGESPGLSLVDEVVAAAIAAGVPITMIPDVPDDRGPASGIGAIVAGHGTDVSNAVVPPEMNASARASA